MLMLRYFDSLPVGSIARVTGRSVGTVTEADYPAACPSGFEKMLGGPLIMDDSIEERLRQLGEATRRQDCL